MLLIISSTLSSISAIASLAPNNFKNSNLILGSISVFVFSVIIPRFSLHSSLSMVFNLIFLSGILTNTGSNFILALAFFSLTSNIFSSFLIFNSSFFL